MDTKIDKIIDLAKPLLLKLKDAGITTISHLINTRNGYLANILSMTDEDVEHLKNTVYNMCHEEVISGTTYLHEATAKLVVYGTGIAQLDNLLPSSGGLASGEILEIIGMPQSGKTMILNTIAINLMQHCDFNIFWIDTNDNFSAVKLRNIMRARQMSEELQMKVLKQLYIEKHQTPDALIHQLRFLATQVNERHNRYRILFIDSIPAIRYYLEGGHNMTALAKLSEIAQLLKIIAEIRDMAIVTTNLAYHRETNPTSTEPETEETESNGAKSQERSKDSQENDKMLRQHANMHASLGKYWETIPHHRVLVHFKQNPWRPELEDDSIERIISLFSSYSSQSTDPVQITIGNFGVT